MVSMTTGRWMVVAMVAVACTVAQKRQAVEVATDDPGRRREAFEATLRVLDENPAYVDEFFQLARGHEATLGRFLRNSARALDEPWLAEATAHELVLAPAGLRQVMVATVDAARDRPDARAALLGSMRDRRTRLAEILLSDPETMKQLFTAMAAVGGAAVADQLRELLAKPGGKG
jgi:hypothetical protein